MIGARQEATMQNSCYKQTNNVTMNPLLPAKVVDCQPAVSHSEMRCKDLGQATRIQTSFIITHSERRLT